MSVFENLDPDLQERIEIQLAQDAGIVIKQGGRLLSLFDDIYFHKVKNSGKGVDFKNYAFSGEVYLVLLAAAQFSKRFWKEQSPEAFYLTKKDVNDIRIIQNIWEHHADFMLSGDVSSMRLKPENMNWINENLGGDFSKVFIISAHPGLYSMSTHLKPMTILKEAQEWWDLVL